jgi:hypothetical protein
MWTCDNGVIIITHSYTTDNMKLPFKTNTGQEVQSNTTQGCRVYVYVYVWLHLLSIILTQRYGTPTLCY